MSFGSNKIPSWGGPTIHRLLAARFSADLKQLQNWDFSTLNRSKPIRVLTRTESSCSDDCPPIGYLLPDFQPIWRNFLIHSPPPPLTRYEGGRHEVEKNYAHKTIDAREVNWYDFGICSVISSKGEANFWYTLRKTKKYVLKWDGLSLKDVGRKI